MQLKTHEHAEILIAFEREYPGRNDKEPLPLWYRGHVYADGQRNELFRAYRRGYSLAKCIYQQSA